MCKGCSRDDISIQGNRKQAKMSQFDTYTITCRNVFRTVNDILILLKLILSFILFVVMFFLLMIERIYNFFFFTVKLSTGLIFFPFVFCSSASGNTIYSLQWQKNQFNKSVSIENIIYPV